ncbi:MAG TPA: hypothetical protein VF771_06735 [Longimicrobiaceae bacterium]
MPTMNVCLWNLQNYGGGNVALKWGADSDLRNMFLRRFLASQRIGVLLVMEAGTNSEQSLRNLVRWLNGELDDHEADWCGSLCGSAVTRQSPNPPRRQTDTGFMTDARVEGYAAVWRDSRDDFAVVPGLYPIATRPFASSRNNVPPDRTPLNLVTRGRPTGEYDIYPAAGGRKRRRTERVFGALGGYVPPNDFPFDLAGDLMDEWPELEFPTTSTRNPSQLAWGNARRPAYVVLNLNAAGTPAQSLVPFVAYHAPSNRGKADLAAFMAGLARELYVTNAVEDGQADPYELLHCRRTVFGGDFNYSVDQDDWPESYGFFVDDFAYAQEGGAQTVAAPPWNAADADRRTTVQLLTGDQHDVPIVSANLNDYLRHKIDLAFTRGAGVAAQRVNVPAILMNDAAGVYAGVLRAFHTHLTGVVAGLVPPNERMDPAGHGPQDYRWVQDARKRWRREWRPLICGSWGGTFQSWATFMTQLNAGRLADARRAAEFYHIFVSDHLPLVATITW